MKLTMKALKSIIQKYNLIHRSDVVKFILENPEKLGLDELSRLAEMVNNDRTETAAYYTDSYLLDCLSGYLPELEGDEVHILEPSVGVGNFLQTIIDRYAPKVNKLIIDVNDIDRDSIALTKALNSHREIPDNVFINYTIANFLEIKPQKRYDLIIGNPPFIKLKASSKLKIYEEYFSDKITKNLSGFFLQEACNHAKNVVMIMPKYFLSNPDFQITRDRVNQYSINYILDFGEKGFKGVLIETVAIIINSSKKRSRNSVTSVYSLTNNFTNTISQEKMTSKQFPSWLIYRNELFDRISENMSFDVFTVFRDRQLTNSLLQSKGDIRVLKSRNIKRDGSGIESIQGYDSFIDENNVNKFSVANFLERDDVFLSPNMTYYPRVIRKPKNTLVNGSVAILIPITDYEITDDHLKFLSSETFEKFYRIARNYSTRSLNIDSNSVKFFGLYNSK